MTICGECEHFIPNYHQSQNPDYAHCVLSYMVVGKNCQPCKKFKIRTSELPCFYSFISEVNGFEYCVHPDTKPLGHTPYCRPDERTSGFRCPLGLPGKIWDLNQDEEADKLAEGQMTLEEF